MEDISAHNTSVGSDAQSDDGSVSTRVESQEEWYEPAQSNNELETLLKSLQDDEDDVALTYRKDNTYQDAIAQFRTEVENYEQTAYLEDFHQVVQDDMLLIGSMSKQDLSAQEQKMKEEQLLLEEQQLQREKEQKERLALLAESAKENVWQESKNLQKEAALRDEILRKRENLLSEQMKKAFQQSESQLRKSLLARQGEVKAFYGDLLLADNQFGGSKGRRWRVEWTKTPQPIQIKLRSIRGIRDKVPAGRYVLMLSLYDRLGGHALRWSKLAGQQWGGATLPVHHDGRFASSELPFQQSVFTVVPPQRSVQPGMILAFELFLLRGATSPTDKVVAWGCFPICDGQFEIIQGCYKLPLLRGFMDHRITKHSTIERLIATDLDHWIANLYIQIYRLPRYLAGQKEYEVELQFSSGLLSYPDRIITAEDSVDGEKIPDYENPNPSSTEDGRSATNVSVNLDDKQTSVYFSSASSAVSSGKVAAIEKKSSVRKRSVASKMSGSSQEPPAYTEKEESLLSVEGQPGMYYKLHYQNPIENYNAAQATSLIPQTPLINRKTVPPSLTHYEDLDRHTFSVQPPFSEKGKLKQHGHERAEYVGRMFLSEMGFRQWMTYDFWITILLLIVIWFCRLYIHYSGQWLFLQAIAIPVSSFVFFPYTVNLNYQSDLLTTAEEAGVVLLGPISNIVIQILLVLVSWFSQLALGGFPLIFSKFIMAFSIWTVLDPIAIAIVDSALLRFNDSPSQPIGDAFKLYWHFLRVEGSGVIGIPLTIFLYLLVIFAASVILYLYFLKLHNNGRILDVFHRLHGEEDIFFVPHDLELSNQELSFIVKKAEQWRGADGERRKVAVYDYVWEEDNMDEEQSREITTHIAIHTLHLDGLRELYRHFLRLPDGAVVEVFEELGSTNLSPDVKTALLKRSNLIENVMTPSTSAVDIPVTVTGDGESNFLKVSQDPKERPPTNESVRTRATIRCDSSTSSTDNVNLGVAPTSSDV